ncbi:hypothetical protein METBIDRAFT_40530 [Metschnikowia bicuspidata var. bicuspidata NRRL YB-4993]|uniref:Uncharacterized protein n=1 Tax=Metschnikowia bicuspidata var. bicuspidata NRRL YB-4993 TaxID=869754 RepID=A0A1A0HD34_9ASCO|nr:hypothetical protein METBIDRAFT_40530 [Metschnikowia bicuspidata var. bicuspidata NRRL YB-4993]OBA21921.1 hypothetical protein METBIDRAFT_40530 [Metschnikowia bicuspidata var. bicuspidata NRRL YB-4993]
MTRTKLTVETLLKLTIPVTLLYSPDMPAASKYIERPFSWAEVQHIVATNDLDVFARSRLQTEHYLAFKRKLRLQETTVYKHLLTESLEWASADAVNGLLDLEIKVRSSGAVPFSNATDLRIIRNDFPYYFEDNVCHLCVWTKEPIPSDPRSDRGDISAETRELIEKYVCQTFVEHAGFARENVLWFRNWEALQSVREISHIHVLLRNASRGQVDMLIGTPGVPIEL